MPFTCKKRQLGGNSTGSSKWSHLRFPFGNVIDLRSGVKWRAQFSLLYCEYNETGIIYWYYPTLSSHLHSVIGKLARCSPHNEPPCPAQCPQMGGETHPSIHSANQQDNNERLASRSPRLQTCMPKAGESQCEDLMPDSRLSLQVQVLCTRIGRARLKVRRRRVRLDRLATHHHSRPGIARRPRLEGIGTSAGHNRAQRRKSRLCSPFLCLQCGCG